MKSKVKAFTLNEMIIVLIISTIVIGIAFTVLSLVQRNMWAIQGNLKVNTDLNRLEQSLWYDINKYQEIAYSKQNERLVFKSQIDSSVYQFKKDMIIKSKDTFNITIQGKVVYFNGNKTSSSKVDAFKLELPKTYGYQSLFFFKRNDATQFMN